MVFEDVDVDATAKELAGGAYFNAGQDCTAVTRVLAAAPIYDRLVEALVAAAEATITGDTERPDAYYGPLNSASHLDKVTRFIRELPDHASVATGGHRVGERGYYFAPTVVTGVRQDDAIVQREVFGPVLTVQPFADYDEAIALANDVEFGLAASVWTRDHGIVQRATRELDFGCVWVNTHIALTAEFPHGGFKASGYGKDLSLYALEEYTRVKHVMSAG